MARNEHLDINENGWTLLTNADVSALRAQSVSGYRILLQATAGTTAPSSDTGCLTLMPNETMAADLSLSDLWPGVAGANRVWGKGDGSVSVSHA